MSYKTLMGILQDIKPEARSVKNDTLAQITTAVLESMFKTAAGFVDLEFKLKYAGAVEEVLRSLPQLHPNASEFADNLILGQLELGAHNTLGLRKAFELIEEQIRKLYEFGAVEDAIKFAELYKALSEQISIT